MAKKFKVRITEEAVDDLDRLYRYIVKDGVVRARKFIGELKKKIHDLRNLPKRGALCHLFTGSQIRFLSHRGYLIFYEIEDNEVFILHITGPGQDWMSLFL